MKTTKNVGPQMYHIVKAAEEFIGFICALTTLWFNFLPWLARLGPINLPEPTSQDQPVLIYAPLG